MKVIDMKSKKTVGKRCYESHPPLEIDKGLFIYGGNCSTPVVKDADIYVALDHSGSDDKHQYPWHDTVAFYFKITDMSVPSDLTEFKAMLTWLAMQLKAGKKIHIGCIGGHGRTGLVLSALRNELTGDPDATQFVRDNYCKKAVESQKQIDWLKKHFGIKKVKAVKMYGGGQASFKSFESGGKSYWSPGSGSIESDEDFTAMSVLTSTTIWGRHIKPDKK